MPELAAACVVLLSLAACFLVSLTWSRTRFHSAVLIHTQSESLSPNYGSHVLSNGVSAMTMSLPHNMLEYVAGLYHVDCVEAGHVVQITAGSLGTSWDGVTASRATCDSAGAGFTFHVTSATRIRVISSRGVSFS